MERLIFGFLIGLFSGGALVSVSDKLKAEDEFEKGALVSLKLLDSIGKETIKDTNRVSCFDFYVNKEQHNKISYKKINDNDSKNWFHVRLELFDDKLPTPKEDEILFEYNFYNGFIMNISKFKNNKLAVV